ncbi:MAG: hypothetical protein K0Q71_5284, partial [Thermomicrobiales bacterium]|nr:hypothetical protein [Thermomicrobiales bacterium]
MPADDHLNTAVKLVVLAEETGQKAVDGEAGPFL